jgi:hypothetical protein
MVEGVPVFLMKGHDVLQAALTKTPLGCLQKPLSGLPVPPFVAEEPDGSLGELFRAFATFNRDVNVASDTLGIPCDKDFFIGKTVSRDWPALAACNCSGKSFR